MSNTRPSMLGIAVVILASSVLGLQQDDNSCFVNLCPSRPAQIKARRYDISDLGYNEYFHGWTDVQGQGAANDYCRFVGKGENVHLACALAGTHGESETNYVSAKADFDRGHTNTWYMKDEDGDKRDDYCRCVGTDPQQVVCTKAGPLGFFGSAAQGGNTLTFTPTGNIDCEKRQLRPEFGRMYGSLMKAKSGGL